MGTAEERASGQVWPGSWQDVNPYGNLYEIRPGVKHYHTGADLNLNTPAWDADAHLPVYAVADGVVSHAGKLPGSWGNVVVVGHITAEGAVHSRYAHLETMTIERGDQVKRGDQVGTIGRSAPDSVPPGPYHLHIDISTTGILATSPGDWPGTDLARVHRDYVDPKVFIEAHK